MKINLLPLKQDGSLGPAASFTASKAGKLSQALWLSGLLAPKPLCGALSRCGRCKALFLGSPPEPTQEEGEAFSESELSRGWRLTCRHELGEFQSDLSIALPESAFLCEAAPSDSRPDKQGESAQKESRPQEAPLVLAVDLGTTSLAWNAIDRRTGKSVAGGSELNPQAGAGADVMSRLAFSADRAGKELLSKLVRERLQEILLSLPEPAGEIVLAANTAMTDIFLQKDVSGLSRAPYSLRHKGNESFAVDGLPPVYVPPLIAPFVGGDVSAGLAFLLGERPKRPFLLADLGTNGEIALMDEEGKLFVSSAPLGPALEGIGPDCGRQADAGAITKFRLTPFGVQGFLAGGASAASGFAKGISATGYISFIAAALRCGAITPQGAPAQSPASPLARKILACLDTEPKIARFMVGGGLWISLRDIEEILKVKAAFSISLRAVLEAAGVAPSSLSVYLAGALGEHCAPDDLATLGFIPHGSAASSLPAANTSLKGAAHLAARPGLREKIASLCSGASIAEPSQKTSFQQDYLDAMRFGE